MAENSGKKAVIKDVAKMADVSVATVSRYLNGSSSISTATKQRVAEAIDKLNYYPSSVARALKLEQSKSIMVFSTETALYGASAMINGIEKQATAAGYLTVIISLDADQPADGRRAAMMSNEHNPAGVIFISTDAAIRAAYDMIPERTPRVLVGQQWRDDVPQVSVCEEQGGYIATKYLLSLGHNTVFHVGVPSGGEYRARGWRKALEEAEVPICAPVMTTWNPADAVAIGRQIANRGDVTAAFVANDEIAMGVIAGICQTGKRVPEDISIVGFDDNPLACVCQPALTTVRQKFGEAGAHGVDLLVKLIRHESSTEEMFRDGIVPTLNVPGELVIRDSAAPAQC